MGDDEVDGRQNRPELPFTIELPQGRSLTIRVPTLDDVEALEQLYEELGADDRYRRFFSAFNPNRELVEHWVRAPDAGGYRVVAEDESGKIVADSGYVPLPNGDAEFDLTVARRFRGWLGPYLLDLLLAHAAEAGIPNLEAEVLAQNRRMLALIQNRGYAVIGHDDHTSLRVTVGARTDTPSWPPDTERPRLLVEAPTGRWQGEELARSRGFDVMVCPGPPASRPDRCPLLRGEPCPLAAEADAVVVAFPNRAGTLGDQLCQAHRTLHEHPVVVRERQGGAAGPEAGADSVTTHEADTVASVMESLGERPYVLPRRRREPPPPSG
jgi:RimJ/RimL family protein N-acetyltransferase